MTGYLEQREMMNDCADVVNEVARDLRGLYATLHALAANESAPALADAVELAAQHVLMMHEALSTASEYVTAYVESEA